MRFAKFHDIKNKLKFLKHVEHPTRRLFFLVDSQRSNIGDNIQIRFIRHVCVCMSAIATNGCACGQTQIPKDKFTHTHIRLHNHTL